MATGRSPPRSRADAGRAADENGRQTEAALRPFHDIARGLRVADMHKVHVRAILVKGRLQYTERVGPDFSGFLLDGSCRFVAEECKSFEGQRFSLSNVRPNQRAFLDRVLAARGVAALTVFDALRRAHLCPWAIVRELKSLGFDDLEPHRVNPATYAARLKAWA